MNPSVTPFATSGWEVATAVGTIAAALATVGAVVAALKVAKADRRAAQDNHDAQLTAAATSQAAQIEAQRVRQLREHHLRLLLELSERLAQFLTRGNQAVINEARQHIANLMHALPQELADELPSITFLARSGPAPDDLTQLLIDKYPESVGDANRIRANAGVEIGELIQKVANA